MYVMRWSDIRTWGTDMPPVDGDIVSVPKGMTLLVDQSTLGWMELLSKEPLFLQMRHLWKYMLVSLRSMVDNL